MFCHNHVGIICGRKRICTMCRHPSPLLLLLWLSWPSSLLSGSSCVCVRRACTPCVLLRASEVSVIVNWKRICIWLSVFMSYLMIVYARRWVFCCQFSFRFSSTLALSIDVFCLVLLLFYRHRLLAFSWPRHYFHTLCVCVCIHSAPHIATSLWLTFRALHFSCSSIQASIRIGLPIVCDEGLANKINIFYPKKMACKLGSKSLVNAPMRCALLTYTPTPWYAYQQSKYFLPNKVLTLGALYLISDHIKYTELSW